MRSSRALVAAALVIVGSALVATIVVRAPGLQEGERPSPSAAMPAAASAAIPTPAGGSPPGSVGSAAPSPASSAAPPASPAARGGAGIPAVRIRIDRLGIDLPVVEGDGVTAPDREAAHFPGTAWPDAGSNTYIYGHAREGLFRPLWEAQVGDVVILTLVDATTRCYAIDEIRPRTPWNDISVLQPTAEERLTLQTSTSYTPTAPRFVVIAHPCD